MSAPSPERPLMTGNVIGESLRLTPFVALCWTLAYFHLRPGLSSEPRVSAGAAYVDQ